MREEGREFVKKLEELIIDSSALTKQYIDTKLSNSEQSENFVPLAFTKKKIKILVKSKKIFLTLREEL